MSTAPDHNHHHHHAHPHLPISAIPDLRFERSYIRSVQKYITVTRKPQEGKGKEKADDGSSEVVEVAWKDVLWITLKDQCISPLLQGALWAILGHILYPYAATVGQTIRGHLPSREGKAVGWLRNFVHTLGLSGGAAWNVGTPPQPALASSFRP